MSETNEDLVFTPINPVGIRPNLFMGADREMLMTTGLIAVILVFPSQSIIAAIIGIIIWFVFAHFLRMMAKRDPLMRNVYIRHIHYQRYYPADSAPFAPTRKYNR